METKDFVIIALIVYIVWSLCKKKELEKCDCKKDQTKIELGKDSNCKDGFFE